MKLSQKRWFVSGLLGACAVAITFWRGVMPNTTNLDQRGPSPIKSSRPAPPANGFVGSAACAECHPTIADRYRTHPMSRSMSTLEQPGFEERSGAVSFASGSNIEYLVERKSDRVWHHEIRRDVRGEVIYDQAVEANFSMGSGTRGKGYLMEREDLLFMSPISWYAGKNAWGLSPGYAEERHPRFERRTTDACLSCHAGRVSFRREEPDRYPSPKFLELSIGCERCHGPGEQHITLHRMLAEIHGALEKDDSRHDAVPVSWTESIVNPAKLEPRQREAVCNHCHLQVEHRHLRYGRTYHDFRPGQELDEVMTAFVSDDRSDSGGGSSRAVSQVMQMRESRCYVVSQDRLGCISCHDPHGVPLEVDKLDFYRERCMKCHQDRDCTESVQTRQNVERNSCIACHMPKLSAEDVPHTSQTDHRIPRRREAVSKSTEATNPNQAPTEFHVPFDGWDQRLTKLDAIRAWGLMYAAESEKRSDMQQANAINAKKRLEQVIAERPDDLEALESLASVDLILKRRPEAQRILEQVVDRDPLNEFGLIQLALLLHDDRKWEQSLRYWSRALERNPWIALTHVQYGQTLVKAGQIEGAIAAAKSAIARNPAFLPAHAWLGENLPRAGRVEEGARHRELIERLKGSDGAEK